MTKLIDTQLVILAAACQRPNNLALPLPGHLKGGAAQKVVTALIAKGLLAEVDARRGAPVWRAAEDGRAVTLIATDAATAALGIEADSAHTVAPEAALPEAASAGRRRRSKALAARTAAPVRKSRDETKQAGLIAMLRRAEGATIAEIVEATGWQPHTVRSALAGALKKRLGLTIASEKVEGRGRVYKIEHP
jgi:uncharacterized protein DUF3489